MIAASDDTLCLGVTVLTFGPIKDVLAVSRAVWNVRPDLPIVWGGWHPSLFPDETLAETSIDVSAQAQGEATFREVTDRLDRAEPLDRLRGIAWKDGGTVVRNVGRPPAGVNAFPRHDFGLIDPEPYFALKRRRQPAFITSAGCYFRCGFCADPQVFGRSWSGLEPVRIADDLEELWRRYRFEKIAFQDLHISRSSDGDCGRIPPSRTPLHLDGDDWRRPVYED